MKMSHGYELTNHEATAPLNGKCLTSDATKRNDMKWHVFIAVLEKNFSKESFLTL